MSAIAQAAPCDFKPGAPALIRHDLSVSYCELCGFGYITLIITNPYEGADMSGMTVVENLHSSGLTYDPTAPNPVTFSVNGGPTQVGGAPGISGPNNSILTWTSTQIAALERFEFHADMMQFTTLEITFAVTRDSGLTQEGLISAARQMTAQLTYTAEYETDPPTIPPTYIPCPGMPATVTTGVNTLPLHEPVPYAYKRGRNVDAGQGGYSQTIYGNVNDDIIWRVLIRNYGQAALQDLRFDDVMASGNLVVNYVCPTSAAAAAVAANNGVDPGGNGCVPMPAGNALNNFDVDNPFGNPGNDWPDFVDVPVDDLAYFYFVGKVPQTPNGSCSGNRDNTVSDVQWGCEADSPAGGITTTSTGHTPAPATATLSTLSVNTGDNLDIETRITGVDASQPAGSKGRVRITIRNHTGGTVKNITLRDVLPVEYVVDPTFIPAVTAYGAYGYYPGLTNQIEWTNPAPGTFPLTTTDPALALSNTAPEFALTSSEPHPLYPDQENMLRHGDRLEITFGIILIRPQSYDRIGHLDVVEETPTSTPPQPDGEPVPHDPANEIELTNRLFVEFEDFCDVGVRKTPPVNPLVTTHASDPEDIDVNMAGDILVFILTNDPTQVLPLTVNLTNNGGHDAENYHAYITFGRTADVISAPLGCTLISNPPPLDEWQNQNNPLPIPADAAIYEYAGPAIGPGETVSLQFEVIKSSDPADIIADDLTFRADVIGEITLHNGTLLWFPTPVNPRADGGIDRANNYTLDGVRSRGIGFNLLKFHNGTCSENNPPPSMPDREIQIGEECTYDIESGGWFGFETPGFTWVAVRDVRIFDELPNGQGFISSTDPYAESTAQILNATRHPVGLSPVDEVSAPDWLHWAFNESNNITERDQWFRVSMTSRLLNDPIDTSAAPNAHAALSTNVLTSRFQGLFFNENTGEIENYDIGPHTHGYPREEVRRITMTVTEPRVTVVKEVCNESLYGTGTGCSNFVPLADDGDAYDSYIYRLTLTNEAADSGVTRAPAYDVTVSDRLDASDLAYVLPFDADGLDNDGDGASGGADTDGEGAVSDNTVNNSNPAVITFSYNNSTALQRIDPGQTVRLYYRVDFDDDAAPLQTFTNTADATYDTLAGPTGNQTVEPRPNSDIGGARVYTCPADQAAVRIIPVETRPKRITAVSNTPLSSGPGPQAVSIGEEIEYRLNTLLPVALLRNFVIRDELPEGLRGIEAPVINLDAPPYDEAQFVPGGIITPTVTNDYIEWDFGNQRVTNGNVGNRYDFEIGFIARVENTASTNDGDILSNGDPATVARARYIDEAGHQVTLSFGQVDVRILEPRIALTKAFAVADADAGDVLTVTVTAENTGTATAYNLRVLDDLTGRDMTVTGTVGGTHPPDSIDTTTLGANRPIFSWNAPNGIDPGQTRSFTFTVRVDTSAQPQEVLDNTIQAAWTSLPGQNTALNSTGRIGVDSADDGMRNGALPNAGDPVNDYETDAEDDVAVPGATLVKTDLDPAVIPAIGAHKSFRIDIGLPEGTTHAVVATDSLDRADVSYVLENNATYDIVYTFEGIASINGQPPTEAAFNAFPADGASGSVVWDIGTVVTQTENDPTQSAINPTIRIDYSVRVNNDLVTDNGDRLQNGVELTHTHGETGGTTTLADDTARVTALEPLLTASKTVINVTSGKQPTDPAAGGDILQYQVTLPNSGTSTAHDVNVVDTLPSELALYASFTPTAQIGGAPVAGFVATPANAPNGPLVWGHDNGDDSLDIPVGQSLVLTYRVVVMTLADSFSNSVWADWTSLSGDSAYERTGVGCPDWTAPNDYCTGPAESTIPGQDDNGFEKTIIADTYVVPPLSTADDATVRVGDTLTFRLALNLRGGLTQNIRVQDTLPTGMAFAEVVSINGDATPAYTPPGAGAGSNFDYAPIAASSVPAAGQTGTLTWTIGDVTNDPFGDTTTDTLEIIYRASVLPDAGIAHVDTTTLTNTASFSYTGASALNDDAVTTVHQPVVNQVTKTERSGLTSPANVDVASDTMLFRVQARNTGAAPAYSFTVTDQLPTQLDETSIANLTVSVGGTVLTAGSDYTYTPPAVRGGTMHFLLNTPVNPDQTLIIDYDIGFYTDFGANQVWNNSVTVDAYWSLPDESGQRYGPLGPATFTMHNITNIESPSKTIHSPDPAEATIGQEIVYHITIPGEAVNAAMYDVAITDTLNSNLEYVSATEISGNDFVLNDTSIPPTQVRLAIEQIPAGQQAVIELRARLRNLESANAGDTFTNTVLYTFADSSGGTAQGGGNATTPPVLIVEPTLAMTKTVANATNPGNPPQAGDTLRYTLTFTASGGAVGDNFSDAFDLRLDDTLSLGLAYLGNATVSGAGNTIGDPTVTGDGITTAQTLLWRLADGNADIDIAEGTTVTVTYDTRVLDQVLANQTLSNSATAQWTGLDGPSQYERNGTATPVWNDYYIGPATSSISVADNNTIAKTRLFDTYGAADANLRIGDIVEYELRLGLQEGTHTNLVVTDTLPRGLVFSGVASINGDNTAPYAAAPPFAYPDIPGGAVVTSGDPATGPTTVTWTLGDVVNQADSNPANDAFVIVYYARVLNEVHPQVNTIDLTNTATMTYDTATGPAAGRTDNETVTVLQPMLTVAKSAVAAGGDTVLVANEIVTYTVDIANSGTAPAYDPVLRDIIPQGMRNGAATVTMVSMELLSGGTLPILNPAYDASTGTAIWNFDTGTADHYTIPGGDTLRIVYRAQAESGLGAGMTLTNQAQVQVYYSFDDDAVPVHGGVTGVREIYGPTNTASTTFTTQTPGALLKENPADTTVAIGEPFSYRITVPETARDTALYDVRILDDLGASAADLQFLRVTKIAGSQPWNPANTGTQTNLVIEDTTNGIDIPAGEQIVVEITVRLADTAVNVSGLQFTNTAGYTYNQIDSDDDTRQTGGTGTTPPMTIVGPDEVTLEKTGPATMAVGTPATFTLNVHNPSTGTAWNPTIVDRLPNGTSGGTCAQGPDNVTAQFFLADGVTPAGPPLVRDTDYTVTFIGEPDCQWRLALLSSSGGLVPDNRLIVTYTTTLDPDTDNNATLTNIAGVVQWFSYDPEADDAAPRTYTRELTDGTPGILDHEDAHTVTTEAPVLTFLKRVVNVTTGQDPGVNASPGDTLRYTIQLSNEGPAGIAEFAFVDEPDALNTVPRFAAGTLNLISYPAGADVSATDPNGGANGTGFVSVADLSIGAQGEPNSTVEVVFEITLVPVIDSGTVVLNQARLVSDGLERISDDPNVGGDEDPTETLIASAPIFQVQKTSAYITGDPAVLLAGETLRYTITIRNIGNEDAVNVRLRDYTPSNTTYVAGSTTLNGNPVPDPGPGVNPLHDGILINAPENTTPGYLRADAAAGADTVATVVFDVVVAPNAMNGLVIENQGFVSGNGNGGNVQPEQPSDDPRTPVPDDPTRDVVGSLPLLYAHKTVALFQDMGSPGIVDPGDVLRYTIVISNTGGIAATSVVLTDAVPTNTTYVADSLRLNGVSPGPDGGVSPLIAGLSVHSSDNPGAGIISAGESAVITFEASVNAGVPAGTVIRNQGTLSCDELPDDLTDADGVPSNGRQPTIIVVGNAQLLTITKQVAVVGGGAAQAGGRLEYIIRVTNSSRVPATDVIVTDSLSPPLGNQVAYVPGSGTMNGSAAGVSFIVETLAADYSGTYGDLAAGESFVVRFQVQIFTSISIGTTITNTGVVHWNDPVQSASASVSIDVGGTPGSGTLNGNAWHDANLDTVMDNGENRLEGWSVTLYRNNAALTTVLTDANGLYRLSGLIPNQGTGETYEIRFRARGAGPNAASMGYAHSPFTDGPHRISDITVASGGNLQNLNLPITPNGTVYNSVVREPIAGATVTLLNAATGEPCQSGCFDDPLQQNQVTAEEGFYKFDLNFSQASCPAGGRYLIDVTPPASGYMDTPSRIIPPASDASTAAFSVPDCPGSPDDAVPGTADLCEIIASPAIPPVSVPPNTPGTIYYLHLLFSDGSVPGQSQIFNNPIPIDPMLDEAVAITKTSSQINVTRSSLVPYTITVTNVFGVPLYNVGIVDRFPAGFKYVAGSARVDGVAVEPHIDGRELVWDNPELQVNQRVVIKFLLVVGSGVSEGEYVNRAHVRNNATGDDISGVAMATVRVVPDPDFDCTDVIGKVFDDRNLNGRQDKDEKGLAGVRVVTVRGLIATTDKHGRFHITCAAVPDEDRGSNFILKLDERSLPTGFRMTTENPRVQRATRGKMIRFNFGATIHRVVRIDLADGVFEPKTSKLRLQWEPKIDQLIKALKQGPSVLRLSYLADIESKSLVNKRLRAMKKMITKRWEQSEGGYSLTIETETFWRRGAPFKGDR